MSYGYDYMNNCMISKAVLTDASEMIEVLIILGADINEIGDMGVTPLSIACQKGDYNIVKYLIEKGAAINMVDSNNKKAIDYAIENNYQDIIDLINSYNMLEKSEVECDLDALHMN
jgi:ankyrin repeat protein